MSKTKEVATLSTKELEQLLKERKAAETAEREAKRNEYEQRKNKLISGLGDKAKFLSKEIAAFKMSAMADVEDFRALLLEYGDIRKGDKNKGNFELKNDRYKLQYSSQVKKGFDERSELAEQKLKAFLETTVKKRDLKLHKLILSLLVRNHKTGDLDISNVQRLYQMENDFEDANWTEAIRLFKESYNAESTTIYLRVFEKQADGSWKLVNLNFASV
jgi:hypothetical protein